MNSITFLEMLRKSKIEKERQPTTSCLWYGCTKEPVKGKIFCEECSKNKVTTEDHRDMKFEDIFDMSVNKTGIPFKVITGTVEQVNTKSVDVLLNTNIAYKDKQYKVLEIEWVRPGVFHRPNSRQTFALKVNEV